MPKCINIRRKKRQPCIGDMDELITIEKRTLVPDIEGAGAEEMFTAPVAVWALVETTAGETIFDGVNTDVNVTHKFTINFDANITAESWILHNDNRFDILDVENLDGRQEFMILRATDRGLDTKKASHA